jgi:hypothetical protein
VYVSYQGDLYQLKTQAQLVADGYGEPPPWRVPATARSTSSLCTRDHNEEPDFGFLSVWATWTRNGVSSETRPILPRLQGVCATSRA